MYAPRLKHRLPYLRSIALDCEKRWIMKKGFRERIIVKRKLRAVKVK
jgi:hypothetical protein